jgi:hypothetical protein
MSNLLDPKNNFDLTKFETESFSLNSHYWNPEPEEEKRVVFMEFGVETHTRQDGDGTIELEVAIFLEMHNGRKRRISNGAKRLVSTLKNNDVQPGTPLLISYEGKVKNKTNQFSCDDFEVIPLVPKR